jgi:hypothetical protein
MPLASQEHILAQNDAKICRRNSGGCRTIQEKNARNGDGLELARRSLEADMLDRQKLEAILSNRFPSAAGAHLAAAANAIMGLTGHRTADGANRTDGSPRPTTTVAVSADIEAPIRRVFDLFTDIEHAAERVSGIKRVEMLTPGSFGLGTRWRETREVFGRRDSAKMEVIAFERYRTYTLSHYKAGVHVEIVFSFEPENTGTRVTIEFTLDGTGLPPGLLTPLSWAIAGKVQHVLNRDLTDLKDCLERPSTTSSDRIGHSATVS